MNYNTALSRRKDNYKKLLEEIKKVKNEDIKKVKNKNYSFNLDSFNEKGEKK